MTRTSKSMIGFGAYVVFTGAFLAIAPNTLLTFLLTQHTSEHWIRLLGITAMVLGTYYILAGRHNLVVIARASVWARSGMVVGFTTLVLLGIAPVLLLGIAGNELAGVIWTWWALKADALSGSDVSGGGGAALGVADTATRAAARAGAGLRS